MYYTENDFRLYHHGIKGQKWGVRRYQNPDGSLTEEGKRRYEKLRRNVDTSEKVGTIAGAVAGGTAAAGANVAISLATGVIWPYGQITLTAAAAMYSGAVVGDFMKKHAEKKLSSFEEATGQDKKKTEPHKERSPEEIRRLEDAKLKDIKKSNDLDRQLAAENKRAMMSRAKEKGDYDIEFLEAVQNTGKMGDKKWMQSQYSKYLDDPDDYWKNRNKLPQE